MFAPVLLMPQPPLLMPRLTYDRVICTPHGRFPTQISTEEGHTAGVICLRVAGQPRDDGNGYSMVTLGKINGRISC